MFDENDVLNTMTEEYVNKMTLMDNDVLMSYTFQENKELAQFFIRTILNNDSLVVQRVQVQYVVVGIDKRSSIFDILATDSEGKLYDIELQKVTERATPRRARYYRSKMDQMSLGKGHDYKELPETYVILITKNDYFKKGLPLYNVIQKIEGVDELFDDGTHIIYVNGEIEDTSTALGCLMHDIKEANPKDMKIEIVKHSVLKAKTGEGRNRMTNQEIMRAMGYKDGWNAAIDIGKEQGKQEANLETARRMKEKKFDILSICECTGLSAKEIEAL